METLASLPWAEGKQHFFKDNEKLHSSLLVDGEHIANTCSDKVYYIVGKGTPTINRILYVKDHNTGKIINSIFDYTQQGDNTVVLQSATNNFGNNVTYEVISEHMTIVSNPETIGFVKKILNTVIANKKLSKNNFNNFISTNSSELLEKKLSIVITLKDELDIFNNRGERIFEEEGRLFYIRHNEKVYTGTVWDLENDRKQYALDPDMIYSFTLSNSDNLHSNIDLLDLESGTFDIKEHYDYIGVKSPQTIKIAHNN